MNKTNFFILFYLFITIKTFENCNILNIKNIGNINRNTKDKLPPRYVEEIFNIPSYVELKSFSYYSNSLFYKNVLFII